jgi:pilus assembly protein Flp/PilA
MFYGDMNKSLATKVTLPKMEQPSSFRTSRRSVNGILDCMGIREHIENLGLRVLIELQNLRNDESAQDLVEYALIVAVLAFGSVAGMKSLAAGVSSAFENVSTSLGTSL